MTRANCTNVHLARFSPGVRRAGLNVHDISIVSRSADVLDCEVLLAESYSIAMGKRTARMRLESRTVSSHRRTSGWSMELVKGLFDDAQQLWGAVNP